MTKRCVWLLLAWVCAAPAASQSDRENFLILLIDDAGIEKFGTFDVWQQHSLPTPITPRIDTLASEGVRFSNVWSNPVCSPSRALLLTGRHAFRTGMGANRGVNPDPSDPSIQVGGDYDLPTSEVLLPEMLAPAGYSTAAVGKWHLDRIDPGLVTTHPTDSGFGSYVGTVSNIGYESFTKSGSSQSLTTSYFTWTKLDGSTFATQVVDGVTYPFYSVYSDPFDPSEANYVHETRYAARDLANEAIEKIDADSAGNLSEPWLLYVAFNLAHQPFHTPPSNLSPLTGPQGVPAAKRLYSLTTTFTACPAPNATQLCPTDAQLHRAMLEAVDIEVGRLLDAIPSTVRAHTTVILASDNGSPRTTVDPPFAADHVKASLYEGGINVPLIVRSPRLNTNLPTPGGAPSCGVTSAHQAKESTALASLVDVFETVRDIAKRYDTNVATTGGSAESKSLLPFLCDPNLGTAEQLPNTYQHSEVYAESFVPDGVPSQENSSAADFASASPRYQSRWKRAVRGSQYKLIREHSQDTQLYDLDANPLELSQDSGLQRNLIDDSAYDTIQSQLSAAMNGIFGLSRCSGGTDIDGDLACDLSDNCVVIPGSQLDADTDGYGNLCDGDFDNSGLITVGDFNTFKSCFNNIKAAPGPDPTCTESDMHSTGIFTLGDFNLFKTTFSRKPTAISGPSCAYFPDAPTIKMCRGFDGL